MSRKRKYSKEFRLKAVKEYLVGRNGGYNTIAKKYGINAADLKRWVGLYNYHGEKCFDISGSYCGEFKVHVVEYMHKHSISLRQASMYFCIPTHSTISKWERIYYENGRDALLEERRGRKYMGKKKPLKQKLNVNQNEDLLEEVQRLRAENEYLKKLNALVQERERSEQKKK